MRADCVAKNSSFFQLLYRRRLKNKMIKIPMLLLGWGHFEQYGGGGVHLEKCP